MSEALKELGAHLEFKRTDCVLGWDVTHGELNVDVTPANIAGFVEFLRSDASCKFSTLVDITAVDYPDRAKRFTVVYHLMSLERNQDIRIKVALSNDNCHLPTVSHLWPNANWYEREAWDMYGILFEGHPDLRRILLPKEYEAHPPRKEVKHGNRS